MNGSSDLDVSVIQFAGAERKVSVSEKLFLQASQGGSLDAEFFRQITLHPLVFLANQSVVICNLAWTVNHCLFSFGVEVKVGIILCRG
jgi:hypothetical protein